MFLDNHERRSPVRMNIVKTINNHIWHFVVQIHGKSFTVCLTEDSIHCKKAMNKKSLR